MLVEWFYDYKILAEQDIFQIEFTFSGWNILHSIIADYDRDKGKQHNLTDILEYFSGRNVIREQFAKILLFDALIANTDRHQDNWKIIELFEGDAAEYGISSTNISPAFDNGSSFGHNIFENALIQKMQNIASFNNKGRHHMKLHRDDKKSILHLDTIKVIREYLPDCLQSLQRCLNFSISNIRGDLLEIQALEAKLSSGIIWLTDTRIDFIVNMLHTRQTCFQSELEKLC